MRLMRLGIRSERMLFSQRSDCSDHFAGFFLKVILEGVSLFDSVAAL